MMKRALFLIAALFAFNAHAADYVTLSSDDDVATTMDRLENAVKSKGMTVFARVDHAAGAKAVDMSLSDSQVLIFGNPKLGTMLMQSNGRFAVDLPLKMAVWADADGKVNVTYLSAASLAQAHGGDANSKPFKKMAGALAAFAKVAAGADTSK